MPLPRSVEVAARHQRVGGAAQFSRVRQSIASLLAAVLIGPGMLAMLGENDGPSMLSYGATGAAYGMGFFLPFVLLIFAAAYVVQEMAMRLGSVTGRGLGELVGQRFGRSWGWISTVDVIATNFITLITEVIAIRLGMGYFGVPAWGAVVCAISLVAFTSLSGRYDRWERLCAGLAIFNILFIVVAMLSHPAWQNVGQTLVTWTPFRRAAPANFLMLIASNIGATVTPWMLFYQQSASVDKGMLGADAICAGRANTAAGALLAALCGGAAVVATAPHFLHKVDMGHYLGGLGLPKRCVRLSGQGRRDYLRWA